MTPEYHHTELYIEPAYIFQEYFTAAIVASPFLIFLAYQIWMVLKTIFSSIINVYENTNSTVVRYNQKQEQRTIIPRKIDREAANELHNNYWKKADLQASRGYVQI